ncbi:Imidazole glycerol phosphate synthase subunit HisH [termite gut metagenome]|uniref:Imidazole glycerol phosphate synthase subunit HisH n=1 Tax=termite gut metagenome TaxID=433724 RepID=A0A5J4QH36_9ZZZZ
MHVKKYKEITLTLAIIKYNSGNICSVDYALKRLGIEAEITADKETLLSTDKVIFPGVGEAGTTMDYLRHTGLDELIGNLRQPVLGICLGMQLLCRYSEEGDTSCLNIFDAEVKRFKRQKHEDKVPHIGWNTLTQTRSNLFEGFAPEEFVYFVHSFYVPVNAYTVAETNYILPFSAALHKNNFYATQFHPEKSGGVGERILRNFLELSY